MYIVQTVYIVMKQLNQSHTRHGSVREESSGGRLWICQCPCYRQIGSFIVIRHAADYMVWWWIRVSDYDRRQYDGRKWRRQLLFAVNYRRLQSSKPVILTYGILIESLNTIGAKCWDEQPKGWYTYLIAFNRRMLAIRNFAPTEGCWGLYDAQR